MMLLEIVEITTDASGDFSLDLPRVPKGLLHQYRYVPDGSSPLDTGADLDITGKVSGFVYVNQDNLGTTAFQKLPRYATHDETGAASLFAGSGEPVEDRMGVAEQLSVVIANGGNAKQGTLYLWFEVDG